jgi:ornithine--oxo-acid transaminase
VSEVRGRGLMLAVELHPDAGGGRAYVKRLQSLGVLCKETHDHTIRIAPPLVITAPEVDWAVEQFGKALK